MGSEWAEFTVSDLIKEGAIEKPLDGNHGGIHPKSSDYVSEGIPFVMASDMIGGRVDTTNCKFISKEQAEKLRKGFAKEGDVLLSHKATIGRTAIVEETDDDYIMLTPQVTYYRVADQNRLHNGYLRYYFDSAPFQELFNQWAGGGSTRAYLGITGQLKLPIVVPPLPEQKAIAHILGTLDDKIELNRRMNATLEGMAQALFKSWFVDFDPVIDNALAAGNPIPDELAPRAEARKNSLESRDPSLSADSSAIADATEEALAKAGFPAAFQFTEELGWIPEGWEVKQLDELIKLIGGGTPKTSVEEYWNGDIPWFSVVDAPNDSDVFVIDTEKKITEEGLNKSSTKLLRPGTTIISARGTVGRCALVGVEMTMNQSCYGIKGADGASDSYTYYSIRHYVSDLQQRGHGSVFNTITRDTFRSIKVPFGSVELTKAFEDRVTHLLARIKGNLQEQTTLTKLRDTLLPKLVSGQLRIA